jgi:hypothetical protein
VSLDVGAALRRGAERTATTSGLLLFVPFLAIALLNASASARLTETLADSPAIAELAATLRADGFPELAEALLAAVSTLSTQPLALPVPPAVASGVVLVAAVSLEAVRIVADRTFVSGDTGGLHEPTRRLGRATLSGVVASLLIALALLTGVFLLVLPALVVGVVFFFTRQFIAWEDESVLGALRSSISLAADAPLGVLGLGAGLFVVDVVVGWVVGSVAVIGVPLVVQVTDLAATAGVSVYASAAAADAFRQLRGIEGDGEDEEETEEWEELLP